MDNSITAGTLTMHSVEVKFIVSDDMPYSVNYAVTNTRNKQMATRTATAEAFFAEMEEMEVILGTSWRYSPPGDAMKGGTKP